MNVDTKDLHKEHAPTTVGAIIPVLEEHLEVSKKVVTTGTVRLQKHVEQHQESVSVPLTELHWQVQRVAVDRVVAEAPEIRHEGDTTIYPVMEERLVVTRELVLKEEVHVTRVMSTRTESSSHTVAREVVEEERTR